MARVTATGVEAESLTDFVQRVQTAFRTALGEDLDVSPESPQGQLAAAVGLILAQQDEALVAVSNGTSVRRALGEQMDSLGSLLNITRLAQATSTVTVTLTGTPTSVVPAGSRARTAAGDVFALTAAATIGAGGTVDATMRAVEAGPVAAAAGALTEIVDLVAGWTAVTNAAAATLGRLVESDVAYRARYGRVLARNARSSLEAILSAVLEVDGVTGAVIRDNPTNSNANVQAVTINRRSFLVIVEGGTDAAVAAAIARSKPAGVPMTGAVSVDVPRSSGTGTTPIRFSRVTPVPLTVTVTTVLNTAFPGDGAEEIVRRVVAWAAGEWRSGSGDFDTSGLGIGETLDVNRLLSPILSVPGHAVTTVTAVRKQGGAAIGAVGLAERLTIAAADVTVTVS